eukprot:jgi/Chlat1/5500/Chrsp360S00834
MLRLGAACRRAAAAAAAAAVGGGGLRWWSHRGLVGSSADAGGGSGEGRKTAAEIFAQRIAQLGAPAVVAQSCTGGGRGLYAAEDLPASRRLFAEKPVLAYPSRDRLHEVCYHCLKPLLYCQSPMKHDDGAIGVLFCSKECVAEAQYMRVEAATDLKLFAEHCSSEGLKLPWLTARFAFACMAGMLDPQHLSPLSYVNIPTQGSDKPAHPQQWVTEYELLSGAIAATGSRPDQHSFFTLDWYASVMARLHINVFRVDVPMPGVPHGVGSAAYLLASLFNHSCVPNVEQQWTATATPTFNARFDVKKGEELCISYCDLDWPAEVRQQHLLWAYGFRCTCERCQTGD